MNKYTARSQYLCVILSAMAIVILILIWKQKQHEAQYYKELNDLENEAASIAADAMLLHDEAQTYKAEINRIKSDSAKLMQAYLKKPLKQRIAQAQQIQPTAVVTPTTICFDSTGIDSINKLGMAYQVCVARSAYQDSINMVMDSAYHKCTEANALLNKAVQLKPKPSEATSFIKGLLTGAGALAIIALLL